MLSKILPSLLLATLATSCARGQFAAIEERFRGFDKNSDGVIAREEMQAAPFLQRLDLNNDGQITLEEAHEGVSKMTATGTDTVDATEGGRALFSRLDTNSDGRLSADELPRKQWFNALDANRDGGVTYEEASTALARLRGRGAMPAETAPVTPASEDKTLTEAPMILKADEHGVGQMVPDLPLQDTTGREATLGGFIGGGQGVVIACFGATCPISNKLGPELARLEKDCEGQQVRMLLLCPVAAETTDDIAKFTTTHGLKSPVMHDKQHILTSALAATTTTEVFLIDSARTLVYRGAVNDQYGLGYAKAEPVKTYLRDALAAMLRHEAPAITATTAPGCALDLHEVKTAPAETAITYHRQIARIMQNHCVECHREGGAGPFALTSYEDVIENAGMIRKQVERGVMPPWFAAPLPGQTESPWVNDCSLSARNKADLLSWLASDRPRGDAADAPVALKFPEEWGIGEPDAVLQIPRPISIKAEGTMPYQFVTVPTAFTEDRWVQAYEIQPTDRSVVHHVIVNVHPPGTAVRNRGEGAEGYWAAYVPGNVSHIYPEGFAKKLPAGATVSFQIHYTPRGEATKDQLKMGLVFTDKAPRYIVHTAAVAYPRINIPAGAASHVETKEQTVPGDMNITSYMAHMHVRGKAFKFEVTLPNGRQETLLDIPRYDFNWQLRYDYARPKFLPRGSRVKITAVYDNSEGNPANPDPTRNVRWGPQTADEMMIGYFEYYTPHSGEVALKE